MVRRERNSDLCGFEGAKADVASADLRESEKRKAKAEGKPTTKDEVGRPFAGRTDVERVCGSKRQEPRSFPVTIA